MVLPVLPVLDSLAFWSCTQLLSHLFHILHHLFRQFLSFFVTRRLICIIQMLKCLFKFLSNIVDIQLHLSQRVSLQGCSKREEHDGHIDLIDKLSVFKNKCKLEILVVIPFCRQTLMRPALSNFVFQKL